MKVHDKNPDATIKLCELKSGDTFRKEERGPIHMVCTTNKTSWVSPPLCRVVCVKLDDGTLSAPVEGMKVYPVNVEAKVIKG